MYLWQQNAKLYFLFTCIYFFLKEREMTVVESLVSSDKVHKNAEAWQHQLTAANLCIHTLTCDFCMDTLEI